MLAPLLIAATLIGQYSVAAFFRLPCSQPLVHERADPIVSPGVTSGHVHQILGGNAFDLSMSFESTQAATCSTCKAKKDMSNYWTPTLWYQASNGSYHPVSQVGGATIYYLFRRGFPEEVIHPFPPGLRMVAGNPFLRSYDPASLEQRAVSFVCLDYTPGAPPAPEQPSIFNHNCLNGLRTQVFFPSCWDGQNLDSPNHKSHVAYPDGVDDGKCPSSHPVRLVSLFFEIIWDINAWSTMWWRPDGSHPFVLAMGDRTGYGFHGDFLNGWAPGALQRAIDGCTQDSGNIDECAGSLELYTDDETRSCSLKAARVAKEGVTGWLTALPGCNPIQEGPGAAKPASCGGASPDPGPVGGGGSGNGPKSPNSNPVPNDGSQGTPESSTTAAAPPPRITCGVPLRGRSRGLSSDGLHNRGITPASLHHGSPNLILHRKTTRRLRERL